MRKALVILAFAASPALAGELPPGRAGELERLVLQDCGSCHGMTLKGGLGSDLRAETLAGSAPADLAEIILQGVPGTPMPAWSALLSADEAAWIARYLLGGGVM